MGELAAAQVNADMRYAGARVGIFKKDQVAGTQLLLARNIAAQLIHLFRCARQFYTVGLAESGARKGRAVHSFARSTAPFVGHADIAVDDLV